MAIIPDTNSMSSGYQGYQDPNLVNQTFGYANALTKGGLRDDTITSPWQGLRMMSDALSGNLMRNRAGQLGQQNRNLDASGQMRAVHQPPGMPQASTPIPSSTPGGGSQSAAVAPKTPIMGMPTPPPVPGLAGSIPSGMPGGMPGGPIDPMQALMTQPPVA